MPKSVRKLAKQEIAGILEEIGTLLELKGENPFKTRAYHNAARSIEGLDEDLDALVARDELRKIKGIGEALAEKIGTLVTTGKLAYYDELRASFPEGLLDILAIPGLGPKKVKVLYEELGVRSVRELEYACHENRLIDLPGFGEKSQAKILEGVEFAKKHAGSFLWVEAWAQAEGVLEALRKVRAVKTVEVAGSLRRRKEVVHDADLIVATGQPEEVVKRFVKLAGVARILAAGETKGSVMLETGLQIDLRAVKPAEFPFAMHYFTGSKAHNIAMRALAQRKGFKLNEYGLWKGKRSVKCGTEADLFDALGLSYIPPELREDAGELAAAQDGEIPVLVELGDLEGVLHTHSTWSDGKASIEQMARAAGAMGLTYMGLTDHSKLAAYAGGLKDAEILEQHKEIDALNGKLKGIRILKGIECDILQDGKMDYPDKILARFDFVIGSVHSRFNLPAKQMTDRICKALSNPYVTMIGHPTGRLLLARKGYDVDLRAMIDTAKKHGKFVELNAHPLRQDLDWQHCRYARDQGVRVSINPDAHSTEGLKDIERGMGTARRAWLTKEDVLNVLPLDRVMKLISRRESSKPGARR
ncbi:MAG: DNA polymerase/3'-5' exonuclease PolX [Deltaproteobacteria bacterium]|nr:DNA polymerase/3'-5' exonuclease PolX [Deltaproteobacteria bacterium]